MQNNIDTMAIIWPRIVLFERRVDISRRSGQHERSYDFAFGRVAARVG